MELIDQHTKEIMEGCKGRALDAGLRFETESLEYIVTNQDLLELSPKGMIPSLYEYWVHDLEVIKGKKEYELYPHNPYETVINSRPPLSFYNDNNPDWLNVMIFYHVLGHIDFMQNNAYFCHTWSDDFVGVALADKRLIAELRTRHGRWVDYVIEFARGIDNLTGYYRELSAINLPKDAAGVRLDYYFDVFLQQEKQVSVPEYIKQISLYNQFHNENADQAEAMFLSEVKTSYPEFEANYEDFIAEQTAMPKDLLQYLLMHSPVLNNQDNQWMKSIVEVVRNTSLYFEPQRRTKILNEGWASYWHNQLFLEDDRIQGHETDYARINAFVTSVPKVGFNPYAIGLRLFEHLEERGNRGQLGHAFERIHGIDERKKYDNKAGAGRDLIFDLRTNCCDFLFLNTYVDQDFVDRYKLVVIGERLNLKRQSREFYIKSRKAEDYKAMLLESLIHPPYITVDEERTTGELLCLSHHFEEKQLVPEYVENVMIGLEYLWGNAVELKSNLVYDDGPRPVTYTINKRKLTRHEGK